jgi:hypothetical protein
MVGRKRWSNRRHGGHLFQSQSPGDAGDPVNLPLNIAGLMFKIAHFDGLSGALGCFPVYSSSRI